MTVIRRGVKLRDWLKDRLGDSYVMGYPTNHHCAGVYARAAKGEPAGYYSANDIARAVIRAGKRRRGHAPIGAARLWMDSRYGHIAAVYNAADTKVICNSYRAGGRIDVIDRSAYDNLYDAGWCYPEDIPGWGPVAPGANGTHPTMQPTVHVSHVQPGDTGVEVLIMQKALHAEPKIQLDFSSGPGVMGPRTKAAYKEFQELLGYSGSNADGVPGLPSLTELGRRHDFKAAL
jgi:hypothetical protein